MTYLEVFELTLSWENLRYSNSYEQKDATKFDHFWMMCDVNGRISVIASGDPFKLVAFLCATQMNIYVLVQAKTQK